MKRPVSDTHYPPEDMQALRRLIAQLAPQCGVDLGDRSSVRHFLDADATNPRSESIDPQICQELRAMMVLLYRLEASSSEDLGVEGLRRLWRQHGEIMARFQA
ncbi:hypothetical protein [Ferribacterium limneticum]|uniref:hypothetical protein n=1 Tax=Ferribacterium limneticum TaxID=76259 RepID=UPI001CFB6CCD|nr:hypothetical protein [Ferribacterium limneticum]UCV17969.1 hypothetical protein KI610_14260 [Ferribacterium limneticum]